MPKIFCGGGIWGLRCGFALRRLLPLVVELRPKGLVVVSGLAVV